jgi:spermidine synthase
MIPWTLLDRAKIPGSHEELLFLKRDTEYSIRVGTCELMNSRVTSSEEALAELGCAPIRTRSKPRVLIGGLGMGYTLAAVLRTLGRSAEVVVAELVPEVVKWNRGPLGPLNGNPLNDRRVTVREQDVAEVIASEEAGFDAILLDVDNGPEALVLEGNDQLYGLPGLRGAHRALRSEGVLAIWANGRNPPFTKRLRQAGFEAKEVPARGRGEKGGSRYLVWVAVRGK